MKNSRYSLLFLLLIGFTSGACKKQLNVFPTTSQVDGNVITDQQSAQVVLNGVYYQFTDVSEDFVTGMTRIFWSSINEELPSELAGSITGYSLIDSAILSPGDQYASSIWSYCYAVVNAANGFVKNVAAVNNFPASIKHQMLAEAKFLRAFGNSELLLYFGQYNNPSSKYGIIIRDTFVTADNINLPRSDVAAAYTAILSDLDSAINGLPALNTNIANANASDAKLLKARMLMNRGAAGDYAQVASLTNDIISNGPFVIEDSLKDIFLTKGFTSTEVMLGIQPFPNESYKFLIYQYECDYNATDSFVNLLANDGRNQWVYQYAFNASQGQAVDQLTKYYSGDP